MPTTPDNVEYLIFGLTVFFGIAGSYALSILLRLGKARRDLAKAKRYLHE